MPVEPVVLNGELVEDLERMNAENPEALYITPVVYDSSIVLAAFSDPNVMVTESRKMTDSAEFHWRLGLQSLTGGGCASEFDPMWQTLDSYDLPTVSGERLRLIPEHSFPDLATIPRRNVLNWGNAIRSLDSCAYPWSFWTQRNFGGDTWFINFRCTYFPSGLGILSLDNWGTGRNPWCSCS